MYITMMIECFECECPFELDFDVQNVKVHETEAAAIEELHRLEKEAVSSTGNGYAYRPLKIKV